MSPVFCIATSMVTPIGLGVQENFQAIINNVSGISIYEKHFISDKKFGASLFKNKDLQKKQPANLMDFKYDCKDKPTFRIKNLP